MPSRLEHIVRYLCYFKYSEKFTLFICFNLIQMSLPVVAPGEQVIEMMIPASKVGLIIGKLNTAWPPFSRYMYSEVNDAFFWHSASSCRTSCRHVIFLIVITGSLLIIFISSVLKKTHLYYSTFNPHHSTLDTSRTNCYYLLLGCVLSSVLCSCLIPLI